MARQIRRHGLPATSDQVLIVGGAQHGLAVTAVALLQPGDVVAVDALSYPGFKMVAKRTAWKWLRYRSPLMDPI